MDHSFVICAYKESPYLEECIKSLTAQTEKSVVLMVTSTPNSYISDLAKKYAIPLYINEGEKGIIKNCKNARGRFKSRYYGKDEWKGRLCLRRRGLLENSEGFEKSHFGAFGELRPNHIRKPFEGNKYSYTGKFAQGEINAEESI